MKRNITYHQRLILTFVGGFFFLILIYNLSISDTLVLRTENNSMELQIETNQDAPEQIQFLKQKIGKLEQLIGSEISKDIDIHQLLLEMVTGYCQKNNIILKEFPQPFETEKNGYLTKTAKVVVEGDFVYLLKLVYHIEKNYKVGKVVSVDFKAEKELKTKIRKLQSTIYIQNIKAVTHENNI